MSGAEGHKDCKVANDLNAGHKNGESVHDHSKRRSFFHPFPHFHLHSEKKSIAESGPFILEKDPQSGHYICRQNGRLTLGVIQRTSKTDWMGWKTIGRTKTLGSE